MEIEISANSTDNSYSNNKIFGKIANRNFELRIPKNNSMQVEKIRIEFGTVNVIEFMS